MRQIAADLKTRIGASLLIVLTLVAAASLLTLGVVSLRAAASPYQQEMTAANGADVWIWAGSGARGAELYREVSRMPAVTRISPLLPAGDLRLLLPGHLMNPDVNLIGVQPGRLSMMRPILIAGRSLRPTDHNAGMLDDSIAAYYHLHVGQILRLATASGPRSLRIVGLEASPETCLYPNCTSFLYVLPSTLNALGQSGDFFGVQIRNPGAANRFLAQVQSKAAAGALAYGNTWLNVQQFVEASQELQNIFSLVFGVLAALTAVTLAATILGGAVLARRREMSVLKALGCTRGQVLLMHVGQAALLGAIGGSVGVALGYVFATAQMQPLALSMGVPSAVGFEPAYAAAILIGIVAIAVLAALMAAWRSAAASPGEYLHEGLAPTGEGGGPAFRLLSRLRLPAVVKLGCKDMLVRSGRSSLSTLGLVVAIIALAFSIGLNRGISAFTRDPLLQGVNYSFGVEPGTMSDRAAESLVRHQPFVLRSYTSTQVVAGIPASNVFLPLNAYGGHWQVFPFPVLSGHLPTGTDQIALAPAAASELGVHLGSHLTAKINGVLLHLHVVGIYRSFSNFGDVGMTSAATVRQVMPRLVPGTIYLQLRPGITVHAAVTRLQRAAGDRLGIELPDLALPPFIAQSLQLLRVLALVLAVIAALGVVSATVLTAREQVREIGIRKAIGMSTAQILASTVVGSGLMGLIGGGIGAPLGSALDATTLQLLAVRFGSPGLQGSLATPTVIGLVAAGVAMAWIASLPAVTYAVRVRISTALRAE